MLQLLLPFPAVFHDLDAKNLQEILRGERDHGLSEQRLASGAFMQFIAEHADSQLVASVCTGALILAAAKLLDGYRATTHWLALGDLKATDAVRVVNEFPRWVHDRDRLTGGGISSSLDATIYLISRITSEETAKCVQLLLQYNPHPPFATGDPSVADTDTYLRVAYNK